MVDSGYVLGVIAAMGSVTFVLRALPFVAGHWLQKYPWVHSLGQFLPLAIMTLLLVNSGLAAAAGELRRVVVFGQQILEVARYGCSGNLARRTDGE